MNQPAPSTWEASHLEQADRRQKQVKNLENQITELAAHIYAATYRLLELIREYDECEGWAQPGLRSCAHWLNWKCGIGMGAAREKVRVAHAMKDLPKISEAFREGRISYSKVRAMTRVATPENEDNLMMIALHGTASHVECMVRDFRRVERSEALRQENLRHELRELMLYQVEDGSFILRGRLTPEQGALLKKVLEASMDEEFEERKNVSAETSGGEASPADFAARRADALTRVADAYLSGAGNCKSNGGDRYLVHVHTDAETLNAEGTGAEAELEGCGCVSAETSRRLSCDAGVVHWLETPDGTPLTVGQKTRTVPPAIRRALQRRDRGCVFPGCTCTRFVDAHHVKHWADGGETSMDNLVLLCRHHHRLVHEGGFSVAMDGWGRAQFKQPDGRVLSGNGETRFRGNVPALLNSHADSGLVITPETTVSRWRGEVMDRQLAVEGLMRRSDQTEKDRLF